MIRYTPDRTPGGRRLEESSEQQRDGPARFARALAALQMQSWENAAEKFQEAARHLSQDGLSFFFLKIIEEYKENPLGDSWDGAVPMRDK